MTSAVLTTKGQITIPAEVRKELGLATGDRVYFIRNRETGRFEITRKTGSIMALAGMFKSELPPLTDEQMDEVIGDHLGEDDERIKREWNEMHARENQS